jgi:hypothetical protein
MLIGGGFIVLGSLAAVGAVTEPAGAVQASLSDPPLGGAHHPAASHGPGARKSDECTGRSTLSDISFLVSGVRYSRLTGHVQAGDTVAADFTVAENCNPTVRLTAWKTDPKFTAQQIFQRDQDTFGPGPQSLGPIAIPDKAPDCFFQVDFAIINPEGEHGITYISGDKNGDKNCGSGPTTTTASTAPPSTAPPSTAPPTSGGGGPGVTTTSTTLSPPPINGGSGGATGSTTTASPAASASGAGPASPSSSSSSNGSLAFTGLSARGLLTWAALLWLGGLALLVTTRSRGVRSVPTSASAGGFKSRVRRAVDGIRPEPDHRPWPHGPAPRRRKD